MWRIQQVGIDRPLWRGQIAVHFVRICVQVCCDEGTTHVIAKVLGTSSTYALTDILKLLVNSLARGNKFTMHNSMNINKDNDQCFHISPHLLCFFFCFGEWGVFHWLLDYTRNPILITCYDFLQKIWVAFSLFLKSLKISIDCFLSFLEKFSTN